MLTLVPFFYYYFYYLLSDVHTVSVLISVMDVPKRVANNTHFISTGSIMTGTSTDASALYCITYGNSHDFYLFIDMSLFFIQMKAHLRYDREKSKINLYFGVDWMLLS